MYPLLFTFICCMGGFAIVCSVVDLGERLEAKRQFGRVLRALPTDEVAYLRALAEQRMPLPLPISPLCADGLMQSSRTGRLAYFDTAYKSSLGSSGS